MTESRNKIHLNQIQNTSGYASHLYNANSLKGNQLKASSLSVKTTAGAVLRHNFCSGTELQGGSNSVSKQRVGIKLAASLLIY